MAASVWMKSSVLAEPDVGAAGRADDAGGDRLAQLKWAADCEHPLTDLEFARVAPREHREPFEIDLQQGDVGRRVEADDRAAHLSLVGERDCHLGQRSQVFSDDVAVGDHVPVARDDDARPEAQRTPAAPAEQIVLIAEEVLEERIVGERRGPPLHDLDRRDVRDAFDRRARDAREVGSRRDHWRLRPLCVGWCCCHRRRRFDAGRWRWCVGGRSRPARDRQPGGESGHDQEHRGREPPHATSTRRAPRPPAFGIVIVSSPSLRSAMTDSTSIGSGKRNAREKRPWPRSTR